MRVNLIDWLVNNYNVDSDFLKSELKYSFKNKNIGEYQDKKEAVDIKRLRIARDIIDVLFIWQHADQSAALIEGLGNKEPIRFSSIDVDWREFYNINNLDITDVYYDFNFFKKEKLKICFEGD